MKRRECWPPRCSRPSCQGTRLPSGPYLCADCLKKALVPK